MSGQASDSTDTTKCIGRRPEQGEHSPFGRDETDTSAAPPRASADDSNHSSGSTRKEKLQKPRGQARQRAGSPSPCVCDFVLVLIPPSSSRLLVLSTAACASCPVPLPTLFLPSRAVSARSRAPVHRQGQLQLRRAGRAIAHLGLPSVTPPLRRCPCLVHSCC